jgi:(p)ppGpp synthase/HD superfamily hydrolase
VGTTTDIPSEIGTSELVRDAYELLASKHEGQRQKVNGHPYVEHPIAVATDVSEAVRAEIVAAALLHDIVENSDVGGGRARALWGQGGNARRCNDRHQRGQALRAPQGATASVWWR